MSQECVRLPWRDTELLRKVLRGTTCWESLAEGRDESLRGGRRSDMGRMAERGRGAAVGLGLDASPVGPVLQSTT